MALEEGLPVYNPTHSPSYGFYNQKSMKTTIRYLKKHVFWILPLGGLVMLALIAWPGSTPPNISDSESLRQGDAFPHEPIVGLPDTPDKLKRIPSHHRIPKGHTDASLLHHEHIPKMDPSAPKGPEITAKEVPKYDPVLSEVLGGLTDDKSLSTEIVQSQHDQQQPTEIPPTPHHDFRQSAVYRFSLGLIFPALHETWSEAVKLSQYVIGHHYPIPANHSPQQLLGSSENGFRLSQNSHQYRRHQHHHQKKEVSVYPIVPKKAPKLDHLSPQEYISAIMHEYFWRQRREPDLPQRHAIASKRPPHHEEL